MTIHERLEEIAGELLDAGITREQAVSEFDTTIIETALRRGGSVTRAARIAGVHRNTIHNRLRTKLTESQLVQRRRSYARPQPRRRD